MADEEEIDFRNIFFFAIVSKNVGVEFITTIKPRHKVYVRKLEFSLRTSWLCGSSFEFIRLF